MMRNAHGRARGRMHRLPARLGGVLLALQGGCAGHAPEAPRIADGWTGGGEARPLAAHVFLASHNSYSGGARRSLPDQLDAGVRFLELDVHPDQGRWLLGHDDPGDEVALGDGNPGTLALSDWIDVIATWSTAHPEAAPITVGIDVRHEIGREAGRRFDDLETILERRLGSRLLRPSERDGKTWPSLGALRGRVIVLLLGNRETRGRYATRPSRLMFVDRVPGRADVVDDGVRSVESGRTGLLGDRKGITRIWKFGRHAFDYRHRITFPATDRPFHPRYLEYVKRQGAVR